MKKCSSGSRQVVLFRALAVYAWLTVLSPLSVTDEYYSVYLLCGSLGLLCLWDNSCRGVKFDLLAELSGWLFSFAVVAANYPLYMPLSVLQNVFDLICLLLGGSVVGGQIILWMVNRLPLSQQVRLNQYPCRVFCLSFVSIAAIDLGFLFFCRYPGVLTTDSFSTIGQIVGTDVYNNIMPFWHTITVKPFVTLGMKLFGDINAGIAVFHVAQILFMAASMAAAVTTLYQSGVSSVVTLLIFAMYALLPHNIVYSVTLWKDVPFAGAALLLVTAMFRLLYRVGRYTWVNYAAFLLGALGFCLWRTNGWYTFLATLLVSALCLGRKNRGLLALMAGVCLVGWLMISPVLDLLGVVKSSTLELFAVPMQQLARVIFLDRPLSDQDAFLLGELFHLDRVRELYDPNNVDPIKFYSFQGANLSYITEHWKEYLGMYFRVGLQYPADYFLAWVEQTKGYWNGGYFYYTYTLAEGSAPFGILQRQADNILARCYAAWFRYVEKPELLQWTVSIGLHDWVVAVCAAVTARQRRKEFLLTIPLLVLILGLCLGTPVYSEFRYAYPMILCAPMILGVTFFGGKREQLC